MDHPFEIESKKKRQQYMIEIRKATNDNYFKTRRARTNTGDKPQPNAPSPLDQELERENREFFLDCERKLTAALINNDVASVFETVVQIRSRLSYSESPDLVPWKAFLDTSLFDLLNKNLEDKKYYNQPDIRVEVLW